MADVFQIDLTILNSFGELNPLYEGCKVEKVAGRANLTTPPAEAVEMVGRNIARVVQMAEVAQRDNCVLTGPAPVWAYLVVFHAVVHAFRRVEYDDGRSGRVLVAAHG